MAFRNLLSRKLLSRNMGLRRIVKRRFGTIAAAQAVASILFDSISPTGEAPWALGRTSTDYYKGVSSFSDTVAHTITKVVAPMDGGNNSGGGNITGFVYVCKIYTMSGVGGNLGSLVATSDTVTAPNNLWNHQNQTFNFSTPFSTSASTLYAIVIGLNGASVDASNYGTLWYTSTLNIPGGMDSYTSGGTEQNYYTTLNIQFQIWGTTP